MGQFVLRNPGGGSALRDGDSLRDASSAATYSEALADTLLLDTPGDALTDGSGNIITDGSGHPILADSDGWDRLAHHQTLADILVLSDGQGGGTAYSVSGSSILVLTTATGGAFGGGPVNYTHVGNDTLILTTLSDDSLNFIEIAVQPVLLAPWGRPQDWNAWVEFLRHGDVVATSDPSLGQFQLLGGRVTEDLSRAVTSDLSLDLAFPEDSPLIPQELGDLLVPHGEIVVRVWAGFRGHEVTLGMFDLAALPLRLSPNGLQVSVTGMSFERVLQRAGFWSVETWSAGSSVFGGVVRLVRDVLGESQPVATPPWSQDVPGPEVAFKPGDDRLSVLVKLAQAGNLEVRFNRYGHFVMVKPPTADDFAGAQPEWEILDGPSGTLLGATREFSDEESFNGVVFEGGPLGGDAQAEHIYQAAWLRDQSSPLVFNPSFGPSSSRWGPRPKFIHNELVTDAAQAAALVESELAKLSALSDTVVVSVPANAELEIGQYARLRVGDLGVDAAYRIIRAQHDLAGGPAELLLQRTQRV